MNTGASEPEMQTLPWRPFPEPPQTIASLAIVGFARTKSTSFPK